MGYVYDARLVTERKGNKGDRLMNVLVWLAELGKNEQSNMATLSKSDLPHEFRENSQLLINCLEMIQNLHSKVSAGHIMLIYFTTTHLHLPRDRR
jgi:hypothetical protein